MAGKNEKNMAPTTSLLFTIENHAPAATRCSFQKECGSRNLHEPWNGTCLPKSNHHPKTGANLFISQHSDPSGVLVLHLNKGVGQGHSSLAQSVGISLFGSKESRRSAPISVWKQRGGSFGGCPNAVHEIVSNRRCVGHQVTSRSPKRNSFGYLLEKDT